MPAGLPERGDRRIDEPRVGTVEQAIASRPLPPRGQIQHDPERIRHRRHGAKLKLAHLTLLYPRHCLLTDAGAGGHVLLTEAALSPDGADERADAGILHTERIGLGSCRRLTRGSTWNHTATLAVW